MSVFRSPRDQADAIEHLPLVWHQSDLRPDPVLTAVGTDYQSQHRALRHVYGQATGYRCECGTPAHEWALDIEAVLAGRVVFDEAVRCWWSALITDYVPACLACHGRSTVAEREVLRSRGCLRARRARGIRRG